MYGHVSPDDRFCYYCQKQYASLGTFCVHVVKVHGEDFAKHLKLLKTDGTKNYNYPKEA